MKVTIRSIWGESMFALLLVGFSLASLGLLLVFWNMFPQDRNIHPIYRKSEVERLDEGEDRRRVFSKTPNVRRTYDNAGAIQTR